VTDLRQLIEGIRKFFRLLPDERALLAGTWWLAVFVRAGLWIMPFPTLRAALQRRAGKHRRAPRPAGQLAWAVETASVYVPRATCLTRSLVLENLLQQRGIECRLCIGVRDDAGDGTLAHAWVESGGRVLIGNTGLDSYVPLVSLEGQETRPAAAKGPAPGPLDGA
jgi:hypothetical protein